MEFEVKASVNLEDGKHEGVIERIEYRTDPYEYTDMFIKEKETGFVLKHGCPSLITEKTKLGKLLANFKELKVGEKLNPEHILVEKEITFMTITEKAKDGNEYSKIVDGSIKPLVAEEKV